jgi:DNA polymerase III subunit epsilon
MDFVAIDVETANPNMSSICQIGLVGFRDGEPALEWKSYVDPEDWFSPFNVSIHGIDENTVSGAPTFREVAKELLGHMSCTVVACHTPFDRIAIHQAFRTHGLDPPSCAWLDTAQIARRTWTQFARRGYGLANVCEHIGYEFRHHDALEDAMAAAAILAAAMDVTGLSMEELLGRINRPLGPPTGTHAREGNPDGPLFGEVVVFTGALQIPRREAADHAARVGCEVHDRVTKYTTLLVVGDQDIAKFAGHSKSSKHRKTEELITQGQAIRILGESDFVSMVELGFGHTAGDSS